MENEEVANKSANPSTFKDWMGNAYAPSRAVIYCYNFIKEPTGFATFTHYTSTQIYFPTPCF